MSAPDRDLDQQRRRHRPALWGIWAMLIAAFVGFVVFVGGFLGEEVSGDAEDVNPVSAPQQQED